MHQLARSIIVGMTVDQIGGSSHDHSDDRPHDDTHHVVSAFALLLFESGLETVDAVSTRLTQLGVVRGPIERASLSRLIAKLEGAGLLTARATLDPAGPTYELTAQGRAFTSDWALIMRDRRRLSRAFLALYDRVDA